MKLNILTRTANRPAFFGKCVESIKKQSIYNEDRIVHIIGVEDDEEATKEYAQKDIEFDKTKLVTYKNLWRYGDRHYNIYMNELHNHVEEGWVMYLDDDDWFVDNDAAKKILAKAGEVGEGTMVLWRVGSGDESYPKTSFGITPVFKDLCSCGVAFHSSHAHECKWEPKMGGDFSGIKKLIDSGMKVVWLDETLTAMQAGPGLGLQKDLVDENAT
jgi:glycosyltransferase involved in cell wall biosynthesis